MYTKGLQQLLKHATATAVCKIPKIKIKTNVTKHHVVCTCMFIQASFGTHHIENLDGDTS